MPRGGSGLPCAGWSALHYAASFGFTELIEPLIDRGAPPDTLDAEGMTPIAVAEGVGRHEIAKIIRRCAADREY